MGLFPFKRVGYLFLIPAYFILHNALQYYHVVDFRNLAGYCALWILLPVIVFIPIGLRYKNYPKTAGILASLLLFFFFYYSPVYNLLYTTPALRFFSKISVILSLLLLALAAICFLHRHIRFEKSRLPEFITLVLLVLAIYDLVLFFADDPGKKTRLQPQHILDTAGMVFLEKPDVYYLIFDEHISGKAATRFLDMAQLKTDSLLQARGYRISHNAVSAYVHTTISLAANFWTSPFRESNGKKIELTNYQLALHNLEQNPVIPVFLRNGYKIYNTADYKIYADEPGQKKQTHFGQIEQIVLNQTFPERIVLQLQSILNDRYPHLLMRSGKFRDGLAAAQQNVRSIMAQIVTAAGDASEEPKFVYAHFPVPHLPVLFDSSLTALSPEKFLQIKNEAPDTAAFFKNLLVAQKIILELDDAIKKKNGRPAIIILQSDHGYRGKNGVAPQALKHAILFASSGPENTAAALSSEAYSVNTFRILLRQLTGKNVPLLPANLYTQDSDLLND